MIQFASMLVAAAALAPASSSGPLRKVADLYGARLGMTRIAVRKRMRGKCQLEGSDPRQIFMTCGAKRLSAGFTLAGKAWWITASYDLTDTTLTLQTARAALTERYGKPATISGSELVWLPIGSKADPARCSADVTMAIAAVELYRKGSRLPTVSQGCLPLRSAILAAQSSHHGVIVQEQDPSARIAELAP